MKIFKDNKVYVQKNDILYLNRTDIAIPASIYLSVYGEGITIIDNSNRYEFVEFSDPSEIEFFEKINWIVDYDEVKDRTEEEIIELGQAITRERKEIANKFNSLPQKQKGNFQHLIQECELLDYKRYTLSDMIMFKRGELDFELPEGVERPAIVVAEQYGETSKKVETQEKGIKRFIKRFIKKEKNN